MSKPKPKAKLPKTMYGYYPLDGGNTVYVADSMEELVKDTDATNGVKVGVYELKAVRTLRRTVTLD